MKVFFEFLEKRLLPIAAWPAILALFVMMMATVVDIIGRLLINKPLQGSIEITEIALGLMIVCIFPWIVWQESHISVDLLDNVLPVWIVPWRQLLIHLTAAVAVGFLSKQLFKYAGRAMDYGDVTEFLRIPKGYVFYAMSVMGWLTVIVSALLAVKYAMMIFSPKQTKTSFYMEDNHHD